MKKILSILLAMLLGVLLIVPALAEEEEALTQEDAAWMLYNRGLFLGMKDDAQGFPDFRLEARPTRAQSVTMLVRLLGKEKEALEGEWEMPFLDVPDWAKPYVGFAYENALTNGRSEKVFDAGTVVSASEFLTFVLRAAGYESGKDFTWNAAYTFSDKLGLTDGRYTSTSDFTRGDAAWVCARLLDVKMKKGYTTLGKQLEKAGIRDNTQRCIWEETAEGIQKGQMWFSFAADKDSKECYTSFTVDNASINGVMCQVSSYPTAESAKQLCSEKEQTLLGNTPFAMVCLHFDEKAVLSAGAGEVQAGSISFPALNLKLHCTGVLPDGTEVTELIFMDYYLNEYGGFS